VDACPVHPHTLVPKVDEVPVHPQTLVPQADELPIDDLPRTLPRAPTPADPATEAPAPPARDLGVVELGVAFQAGHKRIALLNEPTVPSMKIVLIHRGVGIERHLLRTSLDSPPKITVV